MTRRLHLGDVLSVTTGRLVSPRLMDGVRDTLEYMTGAQLEIWQLPRARQACMPDLLRQHPGLAEVDPLPPARSSADDTTAERAAAEWLDGQIERLGRYLTVEPLSTGVYEIMDPVAEWLLMGGDPANLIVIDPATVTPEEAARIVMSRLASTEPDTPAGECE